MIQKTGRPPEIYSHDLADALGIAEPELIDLACELDASKSNVINEAAYQDPGVFLAALGLIDAPKNGREKTAHALATAICGTVMLPSGETVDPKEFYGADRALIDLIRATLRDPPKDVNLSLKFHGDRRGLRALLTFETDGNELTFGCLGRGRLPPFHRRIDNDRLRDVAEAIKPRV